MKISTRPCHRPTASLWRRRHCRKADGKESARLQIWDFGGQDIYHGAHALFMRAQAIFMLVWAPEREKSGEQIRDGIRLRDYPLAYWVDYVSHLASTRSPVILVQTRCDRPEDEAVRPPVSDAALSHFPFRKIVHYSAKRDRGRPALDDALNQAVGWLTDEEGVVTIGAKRFRVRRRLEELRDADAELPLEQRPYRMDHSTAIPCVMRGARRRHFNQAFLELFAQCRGRLLSRQPVR